MLAQFLVVLGQVVTLFLLMGVGFALEKLGRLDRVGTGQMSSLLMYVVTPCVVVDALQVRCDAALLRTLGLGALAVTGCYVAYGLVSVLLFRRSDADSRAPLRFGAIYGNVGFMGLPLVRSVLGEEATIFAVVSLALFNIATWTHGAFLMGGRKALSVKKALLNPGVVGVAVGLPLLLTGLRLPGPLGSAVGYLADLNTPIAMVVIGAQMARADFAATFRDRQLWAASGVKLLLIPALTALLLLPLGLDPTFNAATIILAGAPTAGITAMFGESFRRSPERCAQLVALSTLLSILALPVTGTLAQLLLG